MQDAFLVLPVSFSPLEDELHDNRAIPLLPATSQGPADSRSLVNTEDREVASPPWGSDFVLLASWASVLVLPALELLPQHRPRGRGPEINL